jgi:phosphoserine phosphatase
MRFRTLIGFAMLMLLQLSPWVELQASEVLPAWSDGPARQRVIDFVASVTLPDSPDYLPPAERIAVFDNDGTLWSEQPLYVQLRFAIDRVKAMAPEHPEWRNTEPFRSALANDIKGLAAAGKAGLMELIMATHAGMSTEEFAKVATDWLATARHPTLQRPYTELVYQPMLELLAYLRANGFKTFIVSGGGIEFMRPWTEAVYGIPPENVIGSSIQVDFEVSDGRPSLQRKAALNFYDDKAGKPVAIHYHIGRRPVIAVGNSDGDFQMLEWSTAGSGPSLGVYIHHDDAKREVAYDRDSHIGRLARGLDEADERGWLVVSMQRDWQQIFPDAQTR